MAGVFRQAYTRHGKRRESKKWYVEYKDENGKTRRVPGYTDKRATEQLGARLEREAAQRAEGLLGPADGHARRPLSEHVEDFRRFLAAQEDCEAHVARTIRRVLIVSDGCRWKMLKDIDAPPVAEFLADLRADRPVPPLEPARASYTTAEAAKLLGMRAASVHRLVKRGRLACEGTGRKKQFTGTAIEAYQREQAQGIGPTTSNHYLTAVKGFARWLRRSRRMPIDPLEFLSSLNVETDLRHRRRVLPPDEFDRFLNATRCGRAFRGLMGVDRAVLYTMAANSGLRASELGSLWPHSFDLAGSPPTVTVEAAYSKHRTEDLQPLRGDVAGIVCAYLKDRRTDGPVWPGSWTVTAAEMVRLDLAAAGLPYELDGEVFDFHALRHQFIDNLVRTTRHPKDAQTLARHSTITLTYGRYTHPRLREVAGALDGLPALPGPMTAPDAVTLHGSASG